MAFGDFSALGRGLVRVGNPYRVAVRNEAGGFEQRRVFSGKDRAQFGQSLVSPLRRIDLDIETVNLRFPQAADLPCSIA